ncbi:HutD family protein [Kitasatospora sp. NPDC056731]|uniref:HutD/Ves family protein n=1 Tax=Kitasatospora sp. NPDC056731 TaxID=3155422 RepID=UPI00343AA722
MTSSGRIQILRAAERPATTWLNGGGVTREVAGFPVGAGLDAFDWRVSLADVASAGPFSPFPGVDRVITLVEGPGMTLTVDGAEQLVDAPFRPFAFPGDAVTDCRLSAGPVVDFNVMTRRGRVAAAVDVLTAPAVVDVPPGATVLLVCLAGSAAVDGDTVLDRYDAALLEGAGPREVLVRAGGVTAVVTLRPSR